MNDLNDSAYTWLSGLSAAAVRVIKAHQYACIGEIREAITSGALTAEYSPHLGEKTLEEICNWCEAPVPLPRQPQPPPLASQGALARAKRMLERAGYTVLPPTSD